MSGFTRPEELDSSVLLREKCLFGKRGSGKTGDRKIGARQSAARKGSVLGSKMCVLKAYTVLLLCSNDLDQSAYLAGPGFSSICPRCFKPGQSACAGLQHSLLGLLYDHLLGSLIVEDVWESGVVICRCMLLQPVVVQATHLHQCINTVMYGSLDDKATAKGDQCLIFYSVIAQTANVSRPSTSLVDSPKP